MAVSMLGSYTQLLQQLHLMAMSPAAVPRPSTPAVPPAASPTLGRDTYSFTRAVDPNSIFISQIKTDRWNPYATPGNTNCGPASLAMALKALGLRPPGLTDPTNPEMWIDKTRRAMEGDENDFKLTSDDDILRGALASGAQARKVFGLAGVRQALAQGQMVVLAGDPVVYNTRLSNDQYAKFDGGHFILVTAIQGDRAIIDDPQSKVGALSISLSDLQAYMAYKNWNVGVAVWS